MTTSSEETLENWYVLQDSRGNTGDCLMFWAQTGGYTSDLMKADLFTEEQAFAQSCSRHTDIPWPLSYLTARKRRVVDMQVVKLKDVQEVAVDAEVYLQPMMVPFNGNDIAFLSIKGGLTTNLDKAKVLTADEATRWPGVPRSKKYIDANSRGVAYATSVSLKDALRPELYSVIVEQQKVNRERHSYRCWNCGIFVSPSTYYGGRCPRCDNACGP
ncbi:hypothetical protein LC612_36820 [Nostoc sp. CHAB 5834]|nr:hypothetical protein [Nostoc sp. CHAB 5834]